MAHMLATGTLLCDTDGRVASLVQLSRDILERGPCLDSQALERERYAAACQGEDALDMTTEDTADSRQQFALAIQAVVRYEYLRRDEFLPRPKESIRMIALRRPDLHALLEAAHSDVQLSTAEALRQAAELVLGTAEFFEWDSGVDSSQPPAMVDR
jgi:hypothetical protein